MSALGFLEIFLRASDGISISQVSNGEAEYFTKLLKVTQEAL